jgi:L-lysine 2,3-aminomutase
VYIQTPFLKDCNDEGPELVRLYNQLRGAGAELHYIYIPCSPIIGNSIYWTPISSGLKAGTYLRAHLSDRVIPRICTATPIGKIDWNTSGWAVSPVEDNDHFMWIRTPYTPDYFKSFAPLANELDIIRVNEEGTIDVKYMAQIGEEVLFFGSREKRTGEKKPTDQKTLKEIQHFLISDQRLMPSVVETGLPGIKRVHETRVELDPEKAGEAELAYIQNDIRITDVVLSSEKDAVDCLFSIERIVKRLDEIYHVNAVRLRSCLFNYRPGAFSLGAMDRLGAMNRLSVTRPLRLEIETWFLHPDEVTQVHADLMKAARNKGITVYVNTALLSGINDEDEKIHTLAFRLRERGIEFHHLYVAGIPFQNVHNRNKPVDIQDVFDIAGKVRKDGSGREIPRYIIMTPLGEVDFGLSSSFYKSADGLWAKLAPYTIEYYRNMDADFKWPEHIQIIGENPAVKIDGLTSSGDFFTTPLTG